MVKILCINGSPRRGDNTEAVFKEAMDAAAEEGAEAEPTRGMGDARELVVNMV